MSEAYDDDVTDEAPESNALKQARAADKAKAKRIQELEAKLAEFTAKERASSLNAILKAKGVSEKAASLYTSEDVSEDAVSKWIEAHAEVLKPAASAPDPNAQAAARVTAASHGAVNDPVGETSSGMAMGDPDEIMRLLDSASSYEDLVKAGLMPDVN